MSQRTTNTFDGGMVKDVSKAILEKNVYKHSQNGRLIFNDDGTYVWENDKGTKFEFDIQLNYGCEITNQQATSHVIVGHCEFPEYLVLFIQVKIPGEPYSFSEIAQVKEVNDVMVYQTMFYDKNDPFYFQYGIPNGTELEYLLNFQADHPIEAIPVIENIQHERVYFTDDFNPPRVFDIRKAYDDSLQDYATANGGLGSQFGFHHGVFFEPLNIDDCNVHQYDQTFNYNTHMMDISPDVNFGILKLHDQISGGLLSGVYQYTYRMLSDTGVYTDFYPLTPGVTVVDRPKSLGDTDMGAYYFDEVGIASGKGNVLCVEGIDNRFSAIEFAYSYSQSSVGPPTETNIVGQVLIDAELNDPQSITFAEFGDQGPFARKNLLFRHVSNGGKPLTETDIIRKYLAISKAKTIKTKGNRLWLGNIEEEQEIRLTDDELKSIVVKPHYSLILADDRGKTDQLPLMHVNRGSTSLSNTLWLDALGNPVTYTLPINNDWATYKGAQMTMSRKGYWRGETYRLGIVFFTKKGQALPVQHLADVKIPEQYEQNLTYQTIQNNGVLNPVQTVAGSAVATLTAHHNNGRTIYGGNSPVAHPLLRVVGLELDGIDVSNIRDKISGYVIVRCPRDPKVLGQGVMSQAVMGRYGMGHYPDSLTAGGNPLPTSDRNQIIEDKDSIMAPPVSSTLFRRCDNTYQASVHKDYITASTNSESPFGGDNYNPEHDDMFMFTTRTRCERNQTLAPFGQCTGDRGWESLTGTCGPIPPTSWVLDGNWTFAPPANGRMNQYHIWRGRDMDSNWTDLNPTNLIGEISYNESEVRLPLQGHAVQEKFKDNFQTANEWPARIVFDGGILAGFDVKRLFHPIQAKPHWYYFGCPDYMLTNNSPLNIFPFLTTAVTAENEDGSTYETGEYTGNEDFSPPGGYKTKLVGKLQGAYKNYEATSTTTVTVNGVPQTRIDTYSTAFHQEHLYGPNTTADVGTTFFGADFSHNFIGYGPPRMYTKHYHSFTLDFDSSEYPSWYYCGYPGVHAEKTSDSTGAIDLLGIHNLPTTEGEDYAGTKSAVWHNEYLGGGNTAGNLWQGNPSYGTQSWEAQNFGSAPLESPDDYNDNVAENDGKHAFRNIINNKHSLGLTSSIGGMFEMGARHASAPENDDRATTLRLCPNTLDNNFIGSGGILYNYGHFNFWYSESIPVYGIGKHTKKTHFKSPGYIERSASGQTNLKHGTFLGNKKETATVYRPHWGNRADSIANIGSENEGYWDENSLLRDGLIGTQDIESTPLGAVGHNNSLYLYLNDFRYAFAQSDTDAQIGTTETGDHSDVWWVANITDDSKEPYGGLSTVSIEQFPFQSTGAFVPVNDWWDTPDQINGTEIYGGDCFVCLYDLSRLHPHLTGNMAHQFYTRALGIDSNIDYNDQCGQEVVDAYKNWESKDIMGVKNSGQAWLTDMGYGIGMLFPIESNFNLDLSPGVDRLSGYGHMTVHDWRMETDTFNRGFFWHYDCEDQNPARDFKFQQFQISDVLQHQEQYNFYTIANKLLYDQELPFDFPTRWIWSEYKNYGETEDSFRKFPIAQFFDLDGAYGEVWGSAFLFNEIFSFQEDAFGKLRIDEKAVISDAEGGANLVIGNPNVMQGIDYVSSEIGTQSQFSITTSDAVIYWVDAKRAKICRYAGNTPEFISDNKGVHTFIEDISTQYFESNFESPSSNVLDRAAAKVGIWGMYDFNNGDVIFTFGDGSTGSAAELTLIFNEKLDAFTTTIDYGTVPGMYLRFHKKVFVQGVNRPGQPVHSMFAGNRGEYFGVYQDSILEYVVNEAPGYTKIFDTSLINMNDFVTLLGQIVYTSEIGGAQTVTPPTDTRAKYREALFRTPIRQIGSNDRVRGKSMRARMIISNDGSQAQIVSAETIFRPSRRV